MISHYDFLLYSRYFETVIRSIVTGGLVNWWLAALRPDVGILSFTVNGYPYLDLLGRYHYYSLLLYSNDNHCSYAWSWSRTIIVFIIAVVNTKHRIALHPWRGTKLVTSDNLLYLNDWIDKCELLSVYCVLCYCIAKCTHIERVKLAFEE